MSRNGYLSLRWSHRGKRYMMALDQSPDTPLYRGMAERLASQIQGDMATGNFDPSLRKYKPTKESEGIPVWQLFEKFKTWKSRSVDPRTLEKYQVLGRRLQEYWGDRAAKKILPQDAKDFRDRILSRYMRSEATINETITLLKACWEWGRENGKEVGELNPWRSLRLRVPPRKAPKPFTREEMIQILRAIEEGPPSINHYSDFVKAWAFLGARTGEMRGLRWRHCSEDCSQIWIGETLDQRGRTKPTKNAKDSYVDVPDWLAQMLRDRRGEEWSPDELVFKSPDGKPIEAGNFTNRVWRPVLNQLGIAYRRPYCIRHTSISHNADAGVSEADMAALYRTSIPMLRKNYRGSINDRPRLMDWMGED